MAYSKQTWSAGRGGNTPVNVARLQHMEDGIAAAYAVSTGPTDPGPSLQSGTEYVWMKTDGSGNLLDILAGVA